MGYYKFSHNNGPSTVKEKLIVLLLFIIILIFLYFAFKTPIGFLLVGPFLIRAGTIALKNKQTSYKSYIYDGSHAVCLGLTWLLLGIGMFVVSIKMIIEYF